MNQIVVQGMLEKLEYSFEVVDNGQEAVKAVVDSRYDLVLMDCQMPVMDGYQATGHIRSSEAVWSEIAYYRAYRQCHGG